MAAVIGGCYSCVVRSTVSFTGSSTVSFVGEPVKHGAVTDG